MRRIVVLTIAAACACGGEEFTAATPSVNEPAVDASGATDGARGDDGETPTPMNDANGDDGGHVVREAGPDGCALVKHDNGLGGSFYNCTPLGAYDERLAAEACASFVGPDGGCQQVLGAMCPNDVSAYVGEDGGCVSWGFAGLGAGHVEAPGPCGRCARYFDPAWE